MNWPTNDSEGCALFVRGVTRFGAAKPHCAYIRQRRSGCDSDLSSHVLDLLSVGEQRIVVADVSDCLSRRGSQQEYHESVVEE